MKTLPCVTAAEYCGAYRIHVTFDDSTEKTIDFWGWLKGPVFEPLKDPAFFQRFFIDGWTIAWPNGADIAPETLHAAPAVVSSLDAKRRQRTRAAANNALRHGSTGARR